MKMEKIVMGWSDGIELTGKNVDLYKDEILKSISLVCNVEGTEYKEEVFVKMLDSFRRSSEYFPEIFSDLLYRYRSNYMNTYQVNFNLVLYIIKLYKLLSNAEKDVQEIKLNELMIENGFVQFLKVCTEIQVEGTYDLYNNAYTEAKRKVKEYFDNDSDAKPLYNKDLYFKSFIKFKEEVRSHIMSFIIRQDKDHIIELPNSMKCLTIMSAVMAEVLALSVILDEGSTTSFKMTDFYFKDISTEFHYEIIKTR